MAVEFWIHKYTSYTFYINKIVRWCTDNFISLLESNYADYSRMMDCRKSPITMGSKCPVIWSVEFTHEGLQVCCCKLMHRSWNERWERTNERGNVLPCCIWSGALSAERFRLFPNFSSTSINSASSRVNGIGMKSEYTHFSEWDSFQFTCAHNSGNLI